MTKKGLRMKEKAKNYIVLKRKIFQTTIIASLMALNTSSIYASGFETTLNTVLRNYYGIVAKYATILAAVAGITCLAAFFFVPSQKISQLAISWLKRIAAAYAGIMLLPSLIILVASWFGNTNASQDLEIIGNFT